MNNITFKLDKFSEKIITGEILMHSMIVLPI